MVGQDQLKSLTSCLQNHGAVGVDIHTLSYGEYAGSNQAANAVHSVLNNADTASTDRIDLLQEAQSGNINIHLSGSLQNGRTGRNADRSAIDL